MGKRKRNSTDDYEYMANKFKKLEREFRRAREQQRDRNYQSMLSETSDSSSSSDSRSRSRSRSKYGISVPSLPEPPYVEGVPTTAMEAETANTAPLCNDAVPADPPPPASSEAIADPLPSSSAGGQAQILEGELLQMFGEDPSQVKVYNKDVQPELAVRLQHIATIGLSKEVRQELLAKYLIPENCKLIGAPTLNPEIENAVADMVQKRDKGIALRQRQRASAISALAEALTLLTSTDPKNTTLIQLLWDAARLMCDNQVADSSMRRNFALRSLRKDLKDRLQATNIDKMLFGEGLAETLKTAKAISKSVQDMKPPPAKQPASNKKLVSQNLNWRAPAPTRRPKGTNRSKEPPAAQNAHSNRNASASRQSSRPAQNYSRSRR